MRGNIYCQQQVIYNTLKLLSNNTDRNDWIKPKRKIHRENQKQKILTTTTTKCHDTNLIDWILVKCNAIYWRKLNRFIFCAHHKAFLRWQTRAKVILNGSFSHVFFCFFRSFFKILIRIIYHPSVHRSVHSCHTIWRCWRYNWFHV